MRIPGFFIERANFTMHITLSQPFLRSGTVDEFDVVQIKKALNRLGYYLPHKETGITEFADTAIFDALRRFQRDYDLPTTGEAKPGDETLSILNKTLALPRPGKYLWRTVEDEHVRPAHAQYNRTIRSWDDHPDPGDDFNCRCWAEHINPDPDELHKDAINPTIGPFDFLLGGNLLRQGATLALRSILFSSGAGSKEIRLTHQQEGNLSRFIQKIPANSKNTVQIVKLKNGNIKYMATSQGRVPGSKSVYEKTVSPEGITINYKKTTYDQHGNVAHIKIKYSAE